MDEGLPDDLESLLGVAKMMGVAPNLAARVQENGLPEGEEMQYVYQIALKSAIQNELKRREFQEKWQSS